MLDLAIDWLKNQYGSNDFLVGTTVPFVLGAIAYGVRSFLLSCYGYVVRNFTVSIRVNSTTEHFTELNGFIFKNYVWGIFRRNFVISYLYAKSKLIMTSGYGSSLALVNGRPGFISLHSESSDAHSFKEYLELKVLTFRPNKTSAELFGQIEHFIENKEEKNTINVYRSSLSERELVAVKPKRSLSTVFIPKEVKDRVSNTLTKFNSSEKAYVDKGLPWHLGMVLHGPPGTGKTSMIHAIASEFNRDIHYHTSGSLANITVDAAKTILVLEDFDHSNFETSSNVDEKGNNNKERLVSSMADTLNFLDGFLTPHGLIVIATTNHIDRIDPAVLRPGRFDLVEEIPEMAEKEYIDMCEFYGVTPENNFTAKSGARLMSDIKQNWASDYKGKI
jgi:chaperone BCS1